jgi:hypothetical protein
VGDDLDLTGSRPISLGAAWPRAASFVVAQVPSIGAETLALCRLILGFGLLYFWFQYEPADLARLSKLTKPLPFTALVDSFGTLTTLSANAAFCNAFYWVIAALIVSFAVGALVRVTVPLLTLSLWFAAMLLHRGHFMTPLLLGMTLTMFAPWGAAWSVDALRRGRPADVASPLYGYAPWLLGLTIGLAYAAAGLTKLWRTDAAWLWDTGARNGFIQDLGIALSDVGMWMSNDYTLAVLASLFSSFGQIAYVWASFTRSDTVKYAICFGVALPFLIGLVLTMGLFWWPWALLILILYLPWQWIDRKISGPRQRMVEFPVTASFHRRMLLSATVGLIGIHVLAVVTGREYEPLFSNYPMYAAPMRTGSMAEQRTIDVLRKQDRDGRWTVYLALADGTERDVSGEYQLASFLRRARILRSSAYADLDAVVGYRAQRPSEAHCRAASVIDNRAVAIRYNLRRFEVVDGKLTWLPIDATAARTLSLKDCP